MEILETRTLRGPNYWSTYRKKLIIMRLDIGHFEEKPTNKIRGFYGRMKKIMPSLHIHRCSYGEAGGFLKRVKEGTWAGHVIEHFALELQTLAGMDVGYGRTRETEERGIYNVVFAYMEEEVGRYAARSAVRMFLSLAKGEDLEKIKESIAEDVQEMREIRDDVRFGPSTGSIVDEAEKRGIPYIRLNEYSLVQLGYGMNQQRIQATTTDKTNMIAVDLAGDKDATKQTLGDMGVPVPRGYCIRTEEGMDDAIERVGFPVVIKPLDANHGRGATIGIRTKRSAKTAFAKAKEHSRYVIVEKSLEGEDFRALVVNNKLVAVAERTPAHVIGDGKSTIQELIDKTNEDPRRGYGHENVLTQIDVDSQTKRLLKRKKYNLKSVLDKDEKLYLKSTANISTGGTAIDRTDEVHPENVFLFERIAQIIGLDIAGVDVVAPNVSEPLTENGGGIIEVNAAPGFRMHLDPSEGIGRNVAEHVIDMLFPPGTPTRIPIIAITGTNGKTTTTRLIAHILRGTGKTVGFTTTDGTYIQNNKIVSGDNTGPISAQLVLKDPTVDIAVLETARGGIIRSGLGYDYSDVAVVTNIAADHLGSKDINTVEDLARVKSVVPRSVSEEGYAVLNADDENAYKMNELVEGKTVLFSMDENNKHIKRQIELNKVSCVFENGYVTILKGQWKVRVEKVINIPLTFGGKAEFMIQNVLAATLACFVQGVSIESIRVGLTSFTPSASQTPGRLNIIDIRDFTVLMDFAHNPAGFKGLSDFINNLNTTKLTGILSGVGDRRDEDIREMGKLSAETFDKLIIRRGNYLRGRTEEEVFGLFKEGVKESGREVDFQIVKESTDAIFGAFDDAQEGELVVILADSVSKDIAFVDEYREKVENA